MLLKDINIAQPTARLESPAKLFVTHADVIGRHENNPVPTKQAPRNFIAIPPLRTISNAYPTIVINIQGIKYRQRPNRSERIDIGIDTKHPKINGGVARSWESTVLNPRPFTIDGMKTEKAYVGVSTAILISAPI